MGQNGFIPTIMAPWTVVVVVVSIAAVIVVVVAVATRVVCRHWLVVESQQTQ